MCEVTADGDFIVGRSRPKNNPLIHRSEVGKPSFHNDTPNLPKDYTYGAPLKRDPEGAGEVMLSWQSHSTPLSKKEYDFGRDFVTLNRMSLKEGCIAPRDVAEYRKTHEARIKPKANPEATKKRGGLPEHVTSGGARVYGCPSAPSEHVADLIQNRYEMEWVVEQKARHEAIQAAENALKEKHRRSASPTAILSKKAPTPTPAPHPKEYFTMKQFSNVPSRVFSPVSPLPDIHNSRAGSSME